MKSSFDRLFYPFASCLFVLLLLLPFAEEQFHFLPEEINNEQRELAKLPSFMRDSLSLMPKKFDNYYSDNFGFRQSLVAAGATIKCNIFNSSPKSDRINIGRDRWLYLAGTYYKVTQDLTRENSYTRDELVKTVDFWESKRKELEAKGIKYYKAFWPDKHYIYPENMSLAMQYLNAGGPYRSDQALEYIKETGSPVKLVDVRTELLAAKTHSKVYYKYDSHWNSYGAFLAYQKLIKTIAADLPAIRPLTENDLEITYYTGAGRDLENLINMRWEEKNPEVKVKVPAGKEVPTDGYPLKTVIVENDSAQTGLTVLIYRDSFTSMMLPFLSTHFKKIVLIWDVEYDLSMVEKVKPDIVMECYVTRYFR